ncbi:MAG: hypothetical protein IPP55_01970 [Anaerolineales bacterium]|nr:hypothetical protein [Anaerolineales bacterium]
MNNLKSTKILGLSPQWVLRLGYFLAFTMLSLMVREYYLPSPDENESGTGTLIINYISLVSAIGAAVIASMVAGQFSKGESPHRIWVLFSVGLWLWVAGEVSVMDYSFFPADNISPDFEMVDVFWLLGYLFLGLSLFLQLLAAYGVKHRRRIYLFYVGMVAFAVLVAAGLTILIRNQNPEGDSWLFLFVTLLYPVLDVFEGGTALWLSFLFARGQWSRPWWGLILFAITDGIDAFYWSGGYNLVPVSFQNILDFVSLITYPSSYMIAGLALLSNFFILRYGMNSGLLTVPKKKTLSNLGKG